MTKEDLRIILPVLGFSFERNDEYNRDEYDATDFRGHHLRVYADKNTIMIELVAGGARYRKSYRTSVDLAMVPDVAAFLDAFLDEIANTYNLR